MHKRQRTGGTFTGGGGRTFGIVATAVLLPLFHSSPAASQSHPGDQRYVEHTAAVAELEKFGVYDWCYNDAGKIPIFSQIAESGGVTYQQVLARALHELAPAKVPAAAVRAAFCGIVEPGLPAWLADSVWPEKETTAKRRSVDGEIEVWSYGPRGSYSAIFVTVVDGVVADVTTVK